MPFNYWEGNKWPLRVQQRQLHVVTDTTVSLAEADRITESDLHQNTSFFRLQSPSGLVLPARLRLGFLMQGIDDPLRALTLLSRGEARLFSGCTALLTNAGFSWEQACFLAALGRWKVGG